LLEGLPAICLVPIEYLPLQLVSFSNPAGVFDFGKLHDVMIVKYLKFMCKSAKVFLPRVIKLRKALSLVLNSWGWGVA